MASDAWHRPAAVRTVRPSLFRSLPPAPAGRHRCRLARGWALRRADRYTGDRQSGAERHCHRSDHLPGLTPHRKTCPKRLTLAGIFFLLLGGCSAVNPYYDPSKPHHTAEGFRNNYTATVNKKLSELIRWQIERRQQDLPKPPMQPVPIWAPDMAAMQGYSNSPDGNPHSPAVTWIGHQPAGAGWWPECVD